MSPCEEKLHSAEIPTNVARGDPARGRLRTTAPGRAGERSSTADKPPANGTGAQTVTCLESSQRDAPTCPWWVVKHQHPNTERATGRSKPPRRSKTKRGRSRNILEDQVVLGSCRMARGITCLPQTLGPGCTGRPMAEGTRQCRAHPTWAGRSPVIQPSSPAPASRGLQPPHCNLARHTGDGRPSSPLLGGSDVVDPCSVLGGPRALSKATFLGRRGWEEAVRLSSLLHHLHLRVFDPSESQRWDLNRDPGDPSWLPAEGSLQPTPRILPCW